MIKQKSITKTVVPKKGVISHADQRNSQEEFVYEDMEAAPAPSMEKMKKVADIAQAQVVLLKEVAELEERLVEKNRELAANQDTILPEAMSEIGMESFNLTGGIPVKLENNVRAAIPSEKNNPKLRAQGLIYAAKNFPDLIKRQAVLEYDKGIDKKKQAELQKLFKTFLQGIKKAKIPLAVETKDSVHSGSLTKWVKSQDKLSKQVPEDILGVFRSKKAVVVLPKAAEKPLG